MMLAELMVTQCVDILIRALVTDRVTRLIQLDLHEELSVFSNHHFHKSCLFRGASCTDYNRHFLPVTSYLHDDDDDDFRA